MSAIAWEPLEGYGTPAGYGAPAPRRPRLVVVPGGAGADGVGGRRRSTAQAQAGLRLTARGRLVLVVLAALALAAVLGLGGVGGAGATVPERVVTVGAGQTLSEVAAAELPELSISQGVLAIQIANGLSTARVNAGQELVIPRG